MDISNDFFKIIAFARLSNQGLKPLRNSELVLNETSRLERIYEQYWIEALDNVDYYEGAINWINENYKNLIDTTKFLYDFVVSKDESDMRRFLKIDDYSLPQLGKGTYTE